MNLLVTNTGNAQAYGIIRALRPYAQKVVVTMEGDNRFAARLSHAANSRLVDKRYYAPSPAGDWRAGRIQKKNTKREEAYVQTVLEICEKEKIDTIFPSFDPHVYVFSKNKERFDGMGILIPIPDFETVLTPLDKYRILKEADRVGFPCPKTYLPQSEAELKQIADELNFPLVIKPRFSAAGRGTAIVKNFAELVEKIRPVIESHGMPLVQEYIPGQLGEYIHVVMDRSGELQLALHRRFQRYFRKRAFAVYREAVPRQTYANLAGKLLNELGWWGAGLVEVRIDARDDIPKLMEINPRSGSGLLEITEVGINVPLMCLQIARGERVQAVEHYPIGVCLQPVDDSLIFGLRLLNLLVCKCRNILNGPRSDDFLDNPASLNELIQPYRYAYFSGKSIMLDPHVKLLFQDPLVALIVWLQRLTSALQAAADLGSSLLRAILAIWRRRVPADGQAATNESASGTKLAH